MAYFALLESPKLISRKIRVIEKSWNFQTVSCFRFLKTYLIDFTETLINGKILKFPHCGKVHTFCIVGNTGVFIQFFHQFTKNHYISSRQVKSKLSNNEKSINHLIARPVFDEFILFSWNLTFYCWIRVLKVMALLISFVTLSGLELAREQVSTFFQNYWMLKEYIS